MTSNTFNKTSQLSSSDIRKIYNTVQSQYKDRLGYDVSDVALRVTKNPNVDMDGRLDLAMPLDRCGGSWTNKKYITCNKNYSPVIKQYRFPGSDDDFIHTILAHELGHEVFRNQLTDADKKRLWDQIAAEKFHTEYSDTIPEERINKKNEELIAEYLAKKIADPQLDKKTMYKSSGISPNYTHYYAPSSSETQLYQPGESVFDDDPQTKQDLAYLSRIIPDDVLGDFIDKFNDQYKHLPNLPIFMLPRDFGVEDKDGKLHKNMLPTANAYYYNGEIMTRIDTVDIDTVLHEIGHWSHAIMNVTNKVNNNKNKEGLRAIRAVEFPSTSQQSAYLTYIGAEAVWPSYQSAFYYARPKNYGYTDPLDSYYEKLLQTPLSEWYRADPATNTLKIYDPCYVPVDIRFQDPFYKGSPSVTDKLPKDPLQRKLYLFSHVLSPAQRRMLLRGGEGQSFICAADQWLNPELKPYLQGLTRIIRKLLVPYQRVIAQARRSQDKSVSIKGLNIDVFDILNDKLITPEFDPTTGFDLMPLDQLIALYNDLKDVV